ncbi:MAG: hypothetical protein LLF75_03305 [Eubacteriales bacterium]|nr:hypothetical protein [Eubacteriales bacterium]
MEISVSDVVTASSGDIGRKTIQQYGSAGAHGKIAPERPLPRASNCFHTPNAFRILPETQKACAGFRGEFTIAFQESSAQPRG